MLRFNSAYDYISQATTYKDKIAKLDLIIEALEDSVLQAAGQSHITEYDLNDGQTRIKAAYRSPKEVADSINAFEQMRERYKNKLHGPRVRLVDSKNFLR